MFISDVPQIPCDQHLIKINIKVKQPILIAPLVPLSILYSCLWIITLKQLEKSNYFWLGRLMMTSLNHWHVIKDTISPHSWPVFMVFSNISLLGWQWRSYVICKVQACSNRARARADAAVLKFKQPDRVLNYGETVEA